MEKMENNPILGEFSIIIIIFAFTKFLTVGLEFSHVFP